MKSSKAIRLGILICILLGFVVLKLNYNPYPVGDFGRDGAYYYQVARNVSDGNGLLTNISIYAQGFKFLPHPSPIYPVWPLLLGGTGYLIGLDVAATFLPEMFYFLSLVAFYFLVNALLFVESDKEIFLFKKIPFLDYGHVAILLMGFNKMYFKYTSMPYTEGVAFTFLFCSLLVMIKTIQNPSLGWGALSGLLVGISYLTRSQFFGLLFIVPAIIFVSEILRKRVPFACLSSITVAGAVVAIWIVFLWSSFLNFELKVMLDFSSIHMTKEIAPYRWIVETTSFWEFVKDRLSGFLVAFNWENPYSYVSSFGMSTYLVLVALGHIVFRYMVGGLGLRQMAAIQNLKIFGVTLSAIFCVIPVHLLHANRFGGWFFQFRQGLPFIVLIVIAFWYLMSQRASILRIVGILLVGWSLVVGVQEIRKEMWQKYGAPTSAELDLGGWIKSQNNQPIFLATAPHSLGAITRGLFHQAWCDAPRQQMEVFVSILNVTHIIERSTDARCKFFDNVDEYFSNTISFGDDKQKITIWELKS